MFHVPYSSFFHTADHHSIASPPSTNSGRHCQHNTLRTRKKCRTEVFWYVRLGICALLVRLSSDGKFGLPMPRRPMEHQQTPNLQEIRNLAPPVVKDTKIVPPRPTLLKIIKIKGVSLFQFRDTGGVASIVAAFVQSSNFSTIPNTH